jgi:hypothetical protein
MNEQPGWQILRGNKRISGTDLGRFFSHFHSNFLLGEGRLGTGNHV